MNVPLWVKQPLQVALLFLALVLLALPQATFLPLLDRDETRFSEASREMLQSGDLVVPTCNGLPRYQKPPLFYWVQATSFACFGQSEWAARLPSLCATAGTALLIFFWARRVGEGRGTAVTAAVLSVLTLQMMIQGRVATADALLIFCMTLSFWSGWELIEQDRAGRAWSGLWLSVLTLGLALGFLAKGPLAWGPLVMLLIYLSPRARLAVLTAWGVSLGLVLLWAIPAYIQTHGAYWSEEIEKHLLGHTTRAMDGHGATNFLWYVLLLPFYFLTFWISTLPISPILITHRKILFRPGWLQDSTGLNFYLLSNAAFVFIVFSLMVSKLPHYTLPVFPLLALLFARRWAEQKSGRELFLPAGLAIAVAWIFAFSFFFIGELSAPKILVQKATPVLSENTAFATVEYHERSVTWEMRQIVPAFQQDLADDEALNFMALSGPRALFIPTRQWQALVDAQRVEAALEKAEGAPRLGSITFDNIPARKSPPIDPNWKVYHATGLDSAKLLIVDKTGLHLAWINLTLVVKEVPPQDP